MGTRRFVTGLVALSAASACTIVPSSGNPTTVGKEDAGSDPMSQPYVRVIVSPPKQGATPVEIVQGFQAAMTGFDATSQKIAKQYLTPEAQAKWNPAETDAVVCDCRFGVTNLPEADVAEFVLPIKGKRIATIDPQGRYLSAPADSEGAPLVDNITLVKLNGQWRIATPPPGLLLRPADLARAYRSVDLYYPDVTGAGLVTDRVRLAIDPGRGFAESLIRRLLLGPSAPLADGVQNMFPKNTKLRGIRVEDDAVVMDFTGELAQLSAYPERLRVLKAQLAWTFAAVAQLPIVITVNGEPFPGGGLPFQQREYTAFDPAVLPHEALAYFVHNGTLMKQGRTWEESLPVPGAAGQPNQAFDHPAIAEIPYNRVAALRPEPGIWVADLANGSQWQRWITGDRLTPPSWDRYGELWSVEQLPEGGSRVWRAREGQAFPVSAPGLDAARVKAFRVARNGVRAAVVADSGAGESVQIGVIVRLGDYRMGGLEELVPPEQDRTIVDIAWQDDSTLLVLTEKAKQQSLLVYSIADGDGPDTPSVDQRVNSMSAAPGQILAADEDGALRSSDGTKWATPIKSGVTYALYPLG
ncbi:LpqB family beta-propeller domain-containing protein [Acrocarpospora catenulata]|uniref:LpqB family beta-propeller domain-containing protein n=1 Tax=Acrocarpospora catenulata TaxID=2836182 RepID=UPI001BDAEB1C|nr:LpqB family beta-propeller domain-containing protein [Acrocarpospora catenulata]